eukprot:TRINITY_DN24896_c0_g1_i1.p1 TRINITY_DN24896_c0_g1~~TRINITY_DN24896_c0_g1_i1.p1  ORF type:complete len:135 (+),score=19.22 TRINITY_DN24896_c0_g1_i1:82-486(+)
MFVNLVICLVFFFFFQAEDGIRDAQESRGLGDVYKRQQDTNLGWKELTCCCKLVIFNSQCSRLEKNSPKIVVLTYLCVVQLRIHEYTGSVASILVLSSLQPIKVQANDRAELELQAMLGVRCRHTSWTIFILSI